MEAPSGEEREGKATEETALDTAHRLLERYAGGFEGLTTMSAAEVLQRQREQGEASVLLVDCREEGEREVSMIPTAITEREFESIVGRDALPSSVCIVPYCTIGYRSGLLATKLKERFPENEVRNGQGIVLWTHEGNGLVKRAEPQEGGGEGTPPEEPTNEVHVFGDEWDVAAAGYSTVKFGGWDSAIATMGTIANALGVRFWS